jgi:mutual gliding-motility protein MglA
MIEYDESEKRMVLKLVYYGPALSGKTTNLLSLHDILDTRGRGDLMVLDTKDDRTIFFDLLPFFFVTPTGLRIKLKIYTVPGQVRHDATRKAVLARADGVAFIADSQISEKANNSESFDNLERNLALVGIDIERIPLVIQFNKRDLKEVIPEGEIQATWSPTGIPVTVASALHGEGVLETYLKLLELTYHAVNNRYELAERHGTPKETFLRALTGAVIPGEREGGCGSGC